MSVDNFNAINVCYESGDFWKQETLNFPEFIESVLVEIQNGGETCF